MKTLALCLLFQIHGEVLDPAGKPASGATVKLWRWDGETLPKEMRPWLALEYHEVAAQTTADDGRFRFPAREGRAYAVTAERGADELAATIDRVGSGRLLAMRLHAPVTLTGTVARTVSGTKGPAGGAQVTATLDDAYDWDRADTPWPPPFVVRRTATTTKDGTFSLRVPGPGQDLGIDLVATLTDGGNTLRARASTRAPGTPLALELKADRERRAASAQLLDGASGNPVAGARGLIFNGQEVVSDAEGLIRHTPWVGMPILTKTHRRMAIDLSEGGATKVKLEPGIKVRGRLLGTDGNPIARARLVWMSSLTMQRGMGTGFGWPWCDTSDGDGRFELGCMAPGWELVGFVETEGGFVQFLHRVVSQEVDLGAVRVSTEGRVTGRVQGPDGAPVADATVLVQRVADHIEGTPDAAFAAPSRAATTGTTGAFVLTDLAPGTYRIAARSRELAPAFATIVVGPKTPPVALTLAAGDSISGMVLGPDGEPVAGAGVDARFHRGPEEVRVFFDGASARSDGKGRFVLRGLPKDCTFEVRAQAKVGGDWLSTPYREATGGTEDLALQLGR